MAEGAREVADRDMRRRAAEVTVAPSLVADMVGYLRAHDVDADDVCRRAAVNPQGGGDLQRVRGSVMAALWREAIAATGDDDLALHASVSFNPGALDIVGYVMLTCRTADEALRRAARLIRLLNDGIALEITREARTTTCRLTMLAPNDEYLRTERRQVVESVLAGVVHQLRLLTERHLVPVSISMRHVASRSGLKEHERLLGRAPMFGAETDEVVLSNEDLDVPLRSANETLLTAFEAHAASALGMLGAHDSLSRRASTVIVHRLKGEAPTIGDVARELAMSARHLQRGLSAEATSFQALLDDARRELAVRHLADPTATVAKVAWLVGFSEPSAFHRAFRRWTGQSPRAMQMEMH